MNDDQDFELKKPAMWEITDTTPPSELPVEILSEPCESCSG